MCRALGRLGPVLPTTTNAALVGWGLAVWVGLVIFALQRLWRYNRWQGLLIYLILHATLLLWWNSLTPSNQQQWADDVAQMTSGKVDGDQVTLFNVRNFAWHSETDFTRAGKPVTMT